MPKALDEFKEFRDKMYEEKGDRCWFCGVTDNVVCAYLLGYKYHVKDRFFKHPDKIKFYYPVCQNCLQKLTRNRKKFEGKLVVDGVPVLQIEQYFANELLKFLNEFEKYDITAFGLFCEKIGKEKPEQGYIPNFDNDPIIQLLPSISSKLQASELEFVINRIKQYQEDFMFNSSSDYVMLLSVVIDEIHLQRLQSRLLDARPGSQEATILQKELAAKNKDYKDTLASLGIMRKDRDKIAGATIAEISSLIGDENEVRAEMEEWDREVDEMIADKLERDKKLGIYE